MIRRLAGAGTFCLAVLCLFGIGLPARAALIATIQPVNICLDNGTNCVTPEYDAAAVQGFWLAQAGITLDFLPARTFRSTVYRTMETPEEVVDLLLVNPDPAAPRNSGASPITFWFSDRLNIGLAGLALVGGNRGWVAADLEAEFQDVTLAHELGHVFGLSHTSGDWYNLMAPGAGNDGELDDFHLSPEQVALARLSPFLIKSPIGIPAPSALMSLLIGIVGLAAQRRRITLYEGTVSL